MSASLLGRIPVVGGLAYAEHVRGLAGSFTASLVPEPENRYLPQAIAVVVGGRKVGYVAPEIARRYFEPLAAVKAQPVTVQGRPAGQIDCETSGVTLFLDFSALSVEPLP